MKIIQGGNTLHRSVELACVVIALTATVMLGLRLMASPTNVADDSAAHGGGSSEVETEKDGDAHAERVKQVREHHLFASPPNNTFRGQLEGVLGNRALFNGNQSAAVGEKVHGATVLQIGPDWVEIEFESDKKLLWVFNAGSDDPRDNAVSTPSVEGQARTESRNASRPSPRGDRLVPVTDTATRERGRDDMRRRFEMGAEQMTDEQRQQLMEAREAFIRSRGGRE